MVHPIFLTADSQSDTFNIKFIVFTIYCSVQSQNFYPNIYLTYTLINHNINAMWIYYTHGSMEIQ